MKILFDFGLAFKILGFCLIINLAALPAILLLNLNLFLAYASIIMSEGFFSLLLGGIQIFNSLFSTIEKEDDEYVGDGFLKHQFDSVELSVSQKRAMRVRGVTMVIVGLLLMFCLFIAFMAENALFSVAQ
jgi:uncharacterized membrane protein HdeD (DUF308 family)